MKEFSTINEITFVAIKSESQFNVLEKNWNVEISNVDEKGVMNWKATNKDGLTIEYKTNLYYMKKRLLGEYSSKPKEKGTNVQKIGTTKKLTTKGVKLENFDAMFEKACNMLQEYKQAVKIVEKYNEIFNKNDFPNNELKLLQYLQSEQKESISKIRQNQRAKKLFTERYEIAINHLEKLEKQLIKLVMLDKFDEIPTLKQEIKLQKEHIEKMKIQSERF